ncbi:hypothetical protein BSIN_4296 [Burkholderia singularis]|uniref:Uncharacterized protein n=1 Tax=Burkholderia singularis TaxID=1503053 RepID=A0A238H7N5_9BURK|nr:hypothetical protein BSIN_4296 [Burkholderia singularis]
MATSLSYFRGLAAARRVAFRIGRVAWRAVSGTHGASERFRAAW